MNEQLVDGLSFTQVNWNLYAFGQDVKKYQKKIERARSEKSRIKWQRKLDEAQYYLDNNKKRFEQFHKGRLCHLRNPNQHPQSPNHPRHNGGIIQIRHLRP